MMSWIKLGLLGVRLRVARAFGYRLLWTVHQVYPHGQHTRLDRAGVLMMARHATLLVAHDPETAIRAQTELRPRRPVEVMFHGSYVGVYPSGRARAEVRVELGIAEESVVFLCFGELRRDSEISVLLDAYARTESSDTTLVIAGHAKDATAGAAVAAAGASDGRIVRVDGFVPPEQVRELYDASDVAVIPRGNGGTSGSLILALSLGTPIVVADTPLYRRLVRDGAAGWLFRPSDPASLRAALDAAARDGERSARSAAAREIAAELDWNEVAKQFAGLLTR